MHVDVDAASQGGGSLLPTLLLALFAPLAAGCGEPLTDDPVAAHVYALGAFDPDFTDTTDPVPGRIIWISTRAGTARFLASGAELTDVPRAAVDGGELVTTTFAPEVLIPGYNDIEIRFALERHGTTELTTSARLHVSAACTAHDHCTVGACVSYVCVDE